MPRRRSTPARQVEIPGMGLAFEAIRVTSFPLLLAVVMVGCGQTANRQSSDPPPVGSDQTGGVAGFGAMGSGVGGVVASGGATSLRECSRTEDCFLASDCCTCESMPVSITAWQCPGNCPRLACERLGIGEADVRCAEGLCVLARSCDPEGITCDAAVPACGEGEVPMVEGACWGGCLAATECSDG